MYQVLQVNLCWPAWFLVPNILCPTIGNHGEDVISVSGHLPLLRFEVSGDEMRNRQRAERESMASKWRLLI